MPVAWVTLLLVAVFGLHRLALWMEARGWIYYRKRHGSSGSVSAAFLEVQRLLEPQAGHVLEIKESDRLDDSDAGDRRHPEMAPPSH